MLYRCFPIGCQLTLSPALRSVVKKYLHLPDCNTDDLLYSRKRNVKYIGFPELEVEAKICALHDGLQLLSAADPLFGVIVEFARLRGRLEDFSRQLECCFRLHGGHHQEEVAILMSKRFFEMQEMTMLADTQGAGAVWYRVTKLLIYGSDRTSARPVHRCPANTNWHVWDAGRYRPGQYGGWCPVMTQPLRQCSAGVRARRESCIFAVGKIEEEVLSTWAETAKEQTCQLPYGYSSQTKAGSRHQTMRTGLRHGHHCQTGASKITSCGSSGEDK